MTKTRRAIVRAVFLLNMALFFMVAEPAQSADRSPAPQPDSLQTAPPENPEVRPKATPPDLPPPSLDPGIVKQPETVPHPDSVIVPPAVDPGMAVNPEQPQGKKPDRPPPRENPQDDPASRR